MATARKHMIGWLDMREEGATWDAIMQAAQQQYPAQYQE